MKKLPEREQVYKPRGCYKLSLEKESMKVFLLLAAPGICFQRFWRHLYDGGTLNFYMKHFYQIGTWVNFPNTCWYTKVFRNWNLLLSRFDDMTSFSNLSKFCCGEGLEKRQRETTLTLTRKVTTWRYYLTRHRWNTTTTKQMTCRLVESGC